MKTGYSILFVLIISVSSIYKLVVLMNYYFDKTDFIQTYCVNKDRKELCCKGKCYLIKQISEYQNTSDANIPKNNLLTEELFDCILNYTINEQNFNIELLKNNKNKQTLFELCKGYQHSCLKPPISI